MPATEPLTLYHTGPCPNPWKVAIILEELNVPYKLVKVENVKGDEFLSVNPNGRVPALEDPNTGIATWEFHPEKLQSAIDRYANEINRVLGVIELHLGKTGNAYLVGDRCTYADLMFVPWNSLLGFAMGSSFDEEWKSKYPKTYEWHLRLTARDSVKRMEAAKADAK